MTMNLSAFHRLLQQEFYIEEFEDERIKQYLEHIKNEQHKNKKTRLRRRAHPLHSLPLYIGGLLALKSKRFNALLWAEPTWHQLFLSRMHEEGAKDVWLSFQLLKQQSEKVFSTVKNNNKVLADLDDLHHILHQESLTEKQLEGLAALLHSAASQKHIPAFLVHIGSEADLAEIFNLLLITGKNNTKEKVIRYLFKQPALLQYFASALRDEADSSLKQNIFLLAEQNPFFARTVLDYATNLCLDADDHSHAFHILWQKTPGEVKKQFMSQLYSFSNYFKWLLGKKICTYLGWSCSPSHELIHKIEKMSTTISTYASVLTELPVSPQPSGIACASLGSTPLKEEAAAYCFEADMLESPIVGTKSPVQMFLYDTPPRVRLHNAEQSLEREGSKRSFLSVLFDSVEEGSLNEAVRDIHLSESEEDSLNDTIKEVDLTETPEVLLNDTASDIYLSQSEEDSLNETVKGIDLLPSEEDSLDCTLSEFYSSTSEKNNSLDLSVSVVDDDISQEEKQETPIKRKERPLNLSGNIPTEKRKPPRELTFDKPPTSYSLG